MVLENVCAPALLYLAFSIIQIIIDMYRGETIQAFFKFIVMIIFTIVLNAICSSGMTIISWFIVLTGLRKLPGVIRLQKRRNYNLRREGLGGN